MNERRPLRCFFAFAAGAFALCLAGSRVARADQSPPGCTADNSGLTLTRSGNDINNGDTVTYTISFHNSADALSCDVTDAVITLTCPGKKGEPSGTVFALAGGASTTPRWTVRRALTQTASPRRGIASSRSRRA